MATDASPSEHDRESENSQYPHYHHRRHHGHTAELQLHHSEHETDTDTDDSEPDDEHKHESAGEQANEATESSFLDALEAALISPVSSAEHSLRPYAYPVAIALTQYGLAFIMLYFGLGKIIFAVTDIAQTPPVVSGTADALAIFPDPTTFTILVGTWEVWIGMLFLFDRTLPLALLNLLVFHQPATFVPFVIAPDLTFSLWPLLPTFSGLYILKNFLLISGGLILWHHLAYGPDATPAKTKANSGANADADPAKST